MYAIPSASSATTIALEQHPFLQLVQFIDSETKRGIPMIQISTTSDITYVSDSNGVIAMLEPGLSGHSIWISIPSDGQYQFMNGSDPVVGVSGISIPFHSSSLPIVLEMKRLKLAERLYRVTGEGIYRDSFLGKVQVPNISHDTILQKFLLNAQVTGQDSVMNAIYKGKYYWFFGDTNNIQRLLGNFHATAAYTNLKEITSLSTNPNLTYILNGNFVKGVAPVDPKNLPTWIHALYVQRNERMYATYMKPDSNLNIVKRGFLQWNDDLEEFEEISQIDFNTQFSYPIDGSHVVKTAPYHDEEDGYIYFGQPYPIVRCKRYLDLSTYESFTPLKINTSNLDLNNVQLDREEKSGKLIYGWKRSTSPLSAEQMAQLVKMGKMKVQEAYLLQLKTHESGQFIQAHAGSVHYNAFRDRYILIAEQNGGTESSLGEIWYSEGLTPIGPFLYGVKIVTHQKMDFYNPSHHYEFDEENGKIIYFEGTYSNFWTNLPPTPKYNYNQQMYRLDVSKASEQIPIPVFKRIDNNFHTLDRRAIQKLSHKLVAVEFYAFSKPQCESCIPIYQYRMNDQYLLSTEQGLKSQKPIFYALDSNHILEQQLLPFHQELKLHNDQTVIVFSHRHDLAL
ncbi:hypothetical protein FDP41_007188 [Naegleria fowleri]|uniref:Uncharacterized protein n=1 Tax=Naegleria fowleri TaxID=5763 RepID=A0A6A5BH75_NAEFO|nr:uncharacterized protein FDP41_007188 [Naegleria fowleri]KAF0973801.1 hypothetical protein FDP41_007188 [Naegleria fowleri]CAG4715623.1 unnamed protein product [Naegleria fowleri]